MDTGLESVLKIDINLLFGSWFTISTEERNDVLTVNFLQVRHAHNLVRDTVVWDDLEWLVSTELLILFCSRVEKLTT